ncbi:hypothetical protein LBMAG53_23520 [Planctomycetota bacterium]|nr:hypothetical protein LBMAG53_23520 [Planctomycetota bacterium]
MVQPVNSDVVGGIPMVTVIGTPRAMGDLLGRRLRPRLQVLSQFLAGQLLSLTKACGRDLTAEDLRSDLRAAMLPAARIDPQAWMEIESMARSAELPAEDLLLIHGYSDLISHYGCHGSPGQSTLASLPAQRNDSGHTRLAFAWHLDPALMPYVTLVRRVPTHGPANLSLTLAGLHHVAGMSEAGIACASNALVVEDGGGDLLTTHLVASVLNIPVLDDGLSRCQAAPRRGGRAIHGLAASGQRFSVELSGRRTVQLPDPRPDAPRIHTNHAVSDTIRALIAHEEPTSRPRLAAVAGRAVSATRTTNLGIAAWFGLGGAEPDREAARASGAAPDSTVLLIAEPASKTLHLRRGGTAVQLESVGL